jgi:chromosome segregation ATPase
VSEPVQNEQQPEAPEVEEQQPEQFDPERAQAKIKKANQEAANLRARLRELEPLAAKAKELEDAGRTELEKLTARAEQAERERNEASSRALRLDVAFEKGLTPAQAKRLVGATREELEADAEEILRDFPAIKSDGRPKGDADFGARLTAPPANPRQADLAQIEADLRAASRR